NYVAKWDGTSWSALGSGMNDAVHALAVSGSDLYVGGFFRTAGGGAANYIAKWNGSSWSALGSGMNSEVRALSVSGSGLYAGGCALSLSGSDLYAGGYFTTADGKVSSSVARAYLGVAAPQITCQAATNVNQGESVTVIAVVRDSSGLPVTVVWDVNGLIAQTN